jgi:hypothetical protein
MKLNPYHELTELYDPFGIFGVQSILFESFKKIMFAGYSGRKKSRKRDLKEAKYSIERAVRQIETESVSGKIDWISRDYIELLHKKYTEVIKDELQLRTGLIILDFCNTGNVAMLKIAITNLEQMINAS